MDRVAIFRPSAPLLPNTRYNVILLGAKPGSNTGIRAFDGASLETDYLFAFRTGNGSESPSPIRSKLGWCETLSSCAPGQSPVEVLQTCGDQLGCHGSASRDAGWPQGSSLRLQLSNGDVASAVRALVEDERVATETATAPDPGAARRGGGTVFAQNAPYLDPSSPGNSYLLYKMMLGLSEADRPPRVPPGCPSEGIGDGGANDRDAGTGLAPIEPWLPDEAFLPAAPGEYGRLRAAIRGEPMPYGTRTPWRWAATISAWISSGATADLSCNSSH